MDSVLGTKIAQLMGVEASTMTTGMFWFDQEMTSTIQERIFKAAKYFQEKFGIQPTVCYLNPECLTSERLESNNMEILYHGSIPSNHVWLGVKEVLP
jgi:hypothetical protein